MFTVPHMLATHGAVRGGGGGRFTRRRFRCRSVKYALFALKVLQGANRGIVAFNGNCEVIETFSFLFDLLLEVYL